MSLHLSVFRAQNTMENEEAIHLIVVSGKRNLLHFR